MEEDAHIGSFRNISEEIERQPQGSGVVKSHREQVEYISHQASDALAFQKSQKNEELAQTN